MPKLYIPMPALTVADITRFRSYIHHSDSCWLWQGYCDKQGYGTFKAQKHTYRAHRIAYWIQYRIDPKELLICHSCDTPACVNPNHLWSGTTADNVADKIEKGRAATGIKNGRYTHPESTVKGERVNTSKLTELDVREILKQLAQGESQVSLAKRFHITRQSIYAIAHGKTWKHIPR